MPNFAPSSFDELPSAIFCTRKVSGRRGMHAANDYSKSFFCLAKMVDVVFEVVFQRIPKWYNNLASSLYLLRLRDWLSSYLVHSFM